MSGKHYVFDENKSKQEAMSRAEVETAINNLTDSVTESISTISQRVAGLHTIQTLDFNFPPYGQGTTTSISAHGKTVDAYTAHFTLDEPLDMSKVLRVQLIRTYEENITFDNFILQSGSGWLPDKKYIFGEPYKLLDSDKYCFIEIRPTNDGFDCIYYYYYVSGNTYNMNTNPNINDNYTLRLDYIV